MATDMTAQINRETCHRLAPLSGGAARQLVIILHGYGADGRDLIELGRAWQPLLPDAAFIAPNAPHACPYAPGGYQWFDLTGALPEPGSPQSDSLTNDLARAQILLDRAKAAAPALEAFIRAELADLALPADALALAGFSQGAMMALYCGLYCTLQQPPQKQGSADQTHTENSPAQQSHQQSCPAAILAYSGGLPGSHQSSQHAGAQQPAPTSIRCHPQVMLIHGSADQRIPVSALTETEQTLHQLQIPVKAHVITGLGHGIDHNGLTLGGDFLKTAFHQPATRRGGY